MDKEYQEWHFRFAFGVKNAFFEHHESSNHKFISLLSFSLCFWVLMHTICVEKRKRTESIHNWVIKRLTRGAKGWKIGKYDIKLPLENFLLPFRQSIRREQIFLSYLLFLWSEKWGTKKNKWKWLWCIDHISKHGKSSLYKKGFVFET
jgi:hypothetical protein